MNWRLTRPNLPVHFAENEPICFFFPIRRGGVEQFNARIAPVDEADGLREQFEAWSRSRTAFQDSVARNPPIAPADKWQKLYYRGVDPDGAPGPQDHRTQVRACPFKP